ALAAREADAVSLSVRPTEPESALVECVDRLRQAAGDRFEAIELNVNLIAVVGGGAPTPGLRERVRFFAGVDVDDLLRSGSPFVLHGDPDAMSERLTRLRERLGVSYLTVADDLID